MHEDALLLCGGVQALQQTRDVDAMQRQHQPEAAALLEHHGVDGGVGRRVRGGVRIQQRHTVDGVQQACVQLVVDARQLAQRGTTLCTSHK